MSKMFKLFVLALFLGFLVGCGGSGDNSDSNKQSDESALSKNSDESDKSDKSDESDGDNSDGENSDGENNENNDSVVPKPAILPLTLNMVHESGIFPKAEGSRFAIGTYSTSKRYAFLQATLKSVQEVMQTKSGIFTYVPQESTYKYVYNFMRAYVQIPNNGQQDTINLVWSSSKLEDFQTIDKDKNYPVMFGDINGTIVAVTYEHTYEYAQEGDFINYATILEGSNYGFSCNVDKTECAREVREANAIFVWRSNYVEKKASHELWNKSFYRR